MGKGTFLGDLYRQSVQILTGNRTEWMGLLSSVSKYYKMSFDKNVLIYIQRPDAGLLATKQAWEKQTGRHLRAGAKGIGVVDMTGPNASLVYYFELADTVGDDESYRRALDAMWYLDRQYWPGILRYFQQECGTDGQNMENCLCQLAGQQAEAYLSDHPLSVNDQESGGMLYGLPEMAVRAEFEKLVTESAAYIIFRKCGLGTDIFGESEIFQNISHFGSLELFMRLGGSACEVARTVLTEIRQQMVEIREERSRGYERRAGENGISDRTGWNDVSGYPNIRESGMRSESDRQVWETVEEVHAGEPSDTAGRADRTGEDQRDSRSGGSGGGKEKREADTADAGERTDAGERGCFGQGSTHGDADSSGRGDHTLQDRIPVEIGNGNYRFRQEHHLYEGGAKTRFRNNVEAIRLLKQLEKEERGAKGGEQIILARFAGWGGLAEALAPDRGKSHWIKEYEEVKELLTESEMQAAAESTLTSYYTDQALIREIYRALEKFGFRKGNILDPAMGTGNFFSVLPESMNQSKLYGVELDPLAGRIAQMLYPAADIQIKGFEETEYPDNFFDLVIGNVPFHNIKVSDRRYDRFSFKIHEYFIAKSLDKVRPGGLIAVITSKFTMDKENQSVRKYIAQRAELTGAIRLPDNAFRKVAGTEVTTDILFLKKRQREIVPDEENTGWLSVERDQNGIPYNSYFIDHPEMVLGTMVQETGMYGSKDFVTCRAFPGRELSELLQEAVEYLNGVYEEPENADADVTEDREWIPAMPDVKNYSYAEVNAKLYYREDSWMYRQKLTGKKAERVTGMLRIRKALRQLIDFQLYGNGDSEVEGASGEPDQGFQRLLQKLNQEYDSYVAKYGYLNASVNVSAFADDCDAPLLRSVEEEVKNENGKRIKGEYRKTAVFFKATVKHETIPNVAGTVEDALRITMNVRGRFDLKYMQIIYRKRGDRCSQEEILQELGERVYQDPALWNQDPGEGWVLAEEYLSGHVKDKLAQAVLAAEEYPLLFSRNVKALQKVQPEPLKPEEISFVLGSTWIPVKYYRDFMYEKFATAGYNRRRIQLEFSECTGSYYISDKGAERTSIIVNRTYGTTRVNAYEILELSLNLKQVEVRDRQEYNDPQTGEEKVRYVLNRRETLLAREKQAQIKFEFESWLFSDAERGAELTALYNDRFNNIRPRVFQGDDLILPDMSREIILRKHQRDTVAKGIYDSGNLLIAHEVGAGKTMTACAIAYERKRLGICHKPLIVVPNHTLSQWSAEFLRLYPDANILVATAKDFEKSKRRRFVSRVATGDYDCVIMGHSSFELIALSREKQLLAMKKELEQITEQIDEMHAKDGRSWSLKQLMIFRKNLQNRYDRLYNAEKKDDTITFEELGVDNLIVDEAHAYKNNYSYTKMQRVAGVGGQSSQRAMDMHMKCQYINDVICCEL